MARRVSLCTRGYISGLGRVCHVVTPENMKTLSAIDAAQCFRGGDNPIDCLFQRCSELGTESLPPALVPISRLNSLRVSLRPEPDATPHSRSSSSRRTSSHGTAESGPSRCSLHRRSSSAASSGLSSSSAWRSSAERLSQRAIASSARSPGGSFTSSENERDDIL